MSKLFQNKKRYVTAGINGDLPLRFQSFLWNCIDELVASGTELDYLQIFIIYVISNNDDSEVGGVKIIHEQEVPEYKKEYLYQGTEKVEGKVYVIDDGAYATMLWSHEY